MYNIDINKLYKGFVMEKETENKVSQVKPQNAANKSKSSAKKSKPKNT